GTLETTPVRPGAPEMHLDGAAARGSAGTQRCIRPGHGSQDQEIRERDLIRGPLAPVRSPGLETALEESRFLHRPLREARATGLQSTSRSPLRRCPTALQARVAAGGCGYSLNTDSLPRARLV